MKTRIALVSDIGNGTERELVDRHPGRECRSGHDLDDRRHQPVERGKAGVGADGDVVERRGQRIEISDDAAAAGIRARDRRELGELLGNQANLVCQVGYVRRVGGQRIRRWRRRDQQIRKCVVPGIHLGGELSGVAQRRIQLAGTRIERAQQPVGLADQITECLPVGARRAAKPVDRAREIAYRTTVDDDRRRTQDRLHSRGRGGRVQADGVPVAQQRRVGNRWPRRLQCDENVTQRRRGAQLDGGPLGNLDIRADAHRHHGRVIGRAHGVDLPDIGAPEFHLGSRGQVQDVGEHCRQPIGSARHTWRGKRKARKAVGAASTCQQHRRYHRGPREFLPSVHFCPIAARPSST